MSLVQVLIGIFIGFTILFAAVAFGGLAWMLWRLDKSIKSAQESTDKSCHFLQQVAQRLVDAEAAIRLVADAVKDSPVAALPAMVEGQTKACVALVEAVTSLERGTKEYITMLIGGEQSPSVTPDRMNEANREYKISEMMRSGINRKEAVDRLNSEDLYNGFSSGYERQAR